MSHFAFAEPDYRCKGLGPQILHLIMRYGLEELGISCFKVRCSLSPIGDSFQSLRALFSSRLTYRAATIKVYGCSSLRGTRRYSTSKFWQYTFGLYRIKRDGFYRLQTHYSEVFGEYALTLNLDTQSKSTLIDKTNAIGYSLLLETWYTARDLTDLVPTSNFVIVIFPDPSTFQLTIRTGLQKTFLFSSRLENCLTREASWSCLSLLSTCTHCWSACSTMNLTFWLNIATRLIAVVLV